MSVRLKQYKEFRRLIGGLVKFIREVKSNKGKHIPTYCYFASNWIQEFIESRNNVYSRGTFAIIGNSGNAYVPVALSLKQYKIFYTGENVHVDESPWQRYEHLFLNDKRVSLSLGFDYLTHPQYSRLPFWFLRHFQPTDTLDDIREKIEKWNNQSDRVGRDKSCAMICRKDYFGDRAVFADMLESVVPMNYPGQFRHNDDDLFGEKYNDNKLAYLRQFKFNLCPENSDSVGYVTEKIFDAISAGCIPIYWGSGNNPEPGIFNRDAIIFLDLQGDNAEVLAKIKKLNKNNKAYEEFVRQPYFTPKAPELIWNMLHDLENKMVKMVN